MVEVNKWPNSETTEESAYILVLVRIRQLSDIFFVSKHLRSKKKKRVSLVFHINNHGQKGIPHAMIQIAYK